MKNQKIIIFDDENTARFVENIKGWVDVNNRFYGNNPDSEHMARWSSCTHLKCECGKLMSKGWTKCDECRIKAEIERCNQLCFKEYDGGLVYSYLADKYFRNSNEIEDYCSDEEIDPRDLRLVFCEPNRFSQIHSDYWDDVLPEDSEEELPTKLQKALDNLNKVILEMPPASYYPSNTRTEYRSVFY
jgi:hypothetical protein